MTRILLIRHGSTDSMRERLSGRTPGISLNASGRKQAREVGLSLGSQFAVEAIYSSPLERAVETANLMGEALRKETGIEAGLNELDFGAWMGLPFAELEKRSEWQEYNRHRSLLSAPGGESLSMVQSRAWSSLSGICRRHPNDTVAVITHGDVIRALVVLVLGMSFDQLLRLEIAPASVTELAIGSGDPVLGGLNRIFYSQV